MLQPERPRRSRAAAVMAATSANAISRVFIGRFEKVPNPRVRIQEQALGWIEDRGPSRRRSESAPASRPVPSGD